MKKIFIIAGLFLLLIQPCMAQTENISGVDRRLIEIKKIVTLSPQQEETLKTAYTVYQQKSDSILFKVADPQQAAILKYQADKQLMETTITILTDEQQVQYFTVRGTPAAMAKAEARISVLRESGQYSEEELAQKKQEIFDYLIGEQIVIQREGYNIGKQREELIKLSKAQPASLRESDTRVKLKSEGRMNNGKIKW